MYHSKHLSLTGGLWFWLWLFNQMKTSKFDLRNYNIFMYLIGTKYYLVKWFDIFCSMFISDLPKGTFISDFTNPFGLHICASPSCSNLIALKQFISRTKRCFCSLVHVIWVALLGYGTIVCISGPFTNDVRARTCRKGLESLTVIFDQMMRSKFDMKR